MEGSMDLDKMQDGEREELIVNVFKWIQTRNGRLPAKAYWERLRTFPTVYHESVELCPSDDGTGWEVLTDLRPKDDPYYPDQYGSQGFTISNRQTLAALEQRHKNEELSGTV